MKKNAFPRCAAVLTALLLALQGAPAGAFSDPGQAGAGRDGLVTFIVELDGPALLDDEGLAAVYAADPSKYAGASADAREAVVRGQDAVRRRISEAVPQALFRYSYVNLLNGFSVRAPFGSMETIAQIPGVGRVYEAQTYMAPMSAEGDYAAADEEGEDSDSGSTAQMGLAQAWARGYTGAGKVIAVLDSGLNTNHEMFSWMDPAVSEAMPGNYKTKEGLMSTVAANPGMNLFSRGWGSWFHGYDVTGFSASVSAEALAGGFYVSEKIPFCVDYIKGDLDAKVSPSAPHGSDHGTHVASIAAGNAGPANTRFALGAAYDAQIFFFKVFDELDPYEQESDEAVFAALDDAVTLGCDMINLSLGIPNGFTTMRTYAQAGYMRAFNRAKAAGILVSCANGNESVDYYRYGAAGLVNGQTLTSNPNYGVVGFSASLFAPMGVAAAFGKGFDARGYTLTKASFLNSVIPDTEFFDQNGKSFSSSVSKATLVHAGNGYSPSAVKGKAVLVDAADQDAAAGLLVRLKADGAVAAILYDSGSASASQVHPSGALNSCGIPVLGILRAADGEKLKAAGSVSVNFSSRTKRYSSGPGDADEYTGSDAGPVGFTSWGVSESLRLKPDVMAPGTNILSAATLDDDHAYGAKSGTSMAAPNFAGAEMLISQAVDEKIASGVFPVRQGTQAYSDLVDQIAGSSALPYQSGGVYFSPRQQGAGMVRVDRAVDTLVVLRSLTRFNSETGESPRAKLELGDRLGDRFEITFAADNYSSVPVTVGISACVQTDGYTVGSGGVNYVSNTASPFRHAVVSLKDVKGAKILSSAGNINRYRSMVDKGMIEIPAGSSAQVTLTVSLAGENLNKLDTVWTNGMFVEGFVFATSAGLPDQSIPFLGFRGDWNAAPIIDSGSVYETGKAGSLYSANSLNTLIKGQEALLGADWFDDIVYPGYNSQYASYEVETYLMWQGSRLASSSRAFSPNGDGRADIVYAELALIRNAKVMCVLIKDSSGRVVRELGPEFEYFERRDEDSNETQQSASTYGTKYRRRMAWDGLDGDGAGAPDGKYAFEVLAMTEYEYLKIFSDSTPEKEIMAVMRTSPAVQHFSMDFVLDTARPSVSAEFLSGALTLRASDPSGIAHVTVRSADGVLSEHSGWDTSYEATIQLHGADPSTVEIEVYDAAMNMTFACQPSASAYSRILARTAPDYAQGLFSAESDARLRNAWSALDSLLSSGTADWQAAQDLAGELLLARECLTMDPDLVRAIQSLKEALSSLVRGE